MVRIRVTYGSIFSNLAGKTSGEFELEEPTVGGLMKVLSRMHSRSFVEALMEPESGNMLPSVAVLVNGVFSDRDTMLGDGDEVALLVSFVGG